MYLPHCFSKVGIIENFEESGDCIILVPEDETRIQELVDNFIVPMVCECERK